MIDNKYSLLEAIGIGGSSRVFKAQDHDDNQYAIKVIRGDKNYPAPFCAMMVNREFKNLKALEGHPNLLKSFDMNLGGVVELEHTNEMCMYIVLELSSNGSISKYIRNTGPLEEEIARFFMLQILSAVGHIHDKKYAHFDIKLDNILLDEFYNIKVADLGSASDVSELSGYSSSKRGTPNYMAPEVERLEEEEEYDAYAADVYSLGVSLYKMLTGEFPMKESTTGDFSSFETIGSNEVNVQSEKLNSIENKLSNCSEEVRTLLEYMLEEEDIARPSIPDILNDSWISRPFHPGIHEIVYQEMEARKDFIISSKATESSIF